MPFGQRYRAYHGTVVAMIALVKDDFACRAFVRENWGAARLLNVLWVEHIFTTAEVR